MDFHEFGLDIFVRWYVKLPFVVNKAVFFFPLQGAVSQFSGAVVA